MTYSGTYSPRTRDRFRIAVAAVTGVTAVAAFSATGWLAGAAAHDSQARDQLQQLEQEKAAAARATYRHELAVWRKANAENRKAEHQQRPRIELRTRPHRTVVTTRYVQGTAPSTVGTGGQVVAVPASSGQQQAPPPAHAPAPAPPPAPAPSSGS